MPRHVITPLMQYRDGIALGQNHMTRCLTLQTYRLIVYIFPWSPRFQDIPRILMIVSMHRHMRYIDTQTFVA
jgi:hypothetical protein